MGTVAIVCGSHSRGCKYCGQRWEKLCDYPVIRKGKPATCDIPMCGKCAVNVGRDKDYCRPHYNLSGEPQQDSKPPQPETIKRWIEARFISSCAECGAGVIVGQRVLWIKDDRQSVVYCEPCGG